MLAVRSQLVLCALLFLSATQLNAEISSLLPETAKTNHRGATTEHISVVDDVVRMISLTKSGREFSASHDLKNATIAAERFGKGVGALLAFKKSIKLEEGRCGAVYTFKKGEDHFFCLFAFDGDVAQVVAVGGEEKNMVSRHASSLFEKFRRYRIENARQSAR